MVSIHVIEKVTGKNEIAVRRVGKKLGFKPKYDTFTKEHIKVKYTKAEAEKIIEAINKQQKRRHNSQDML